MNNYHAALETQNFVDNLWIETLKWIWIIVNSKKLLESKMIIRVHKIDFSIWYHVETN